MKSSETEIAAIIGTAMGGGFYAGRVNVDGVLYALIVAAKAEGETTLAWSDRYDSIDGAKSYCDGAANTAALASAGSKLAAWASELKTGGESDWYIPAQDELEIIYRNLKPTADENSRHARSGINLSATPPTRPYKPTEPSQTLAEAFQSDGAEAFDDTWYWSSTQHAGYSDCAWIQYFADGLQYSGRKSYAGRARAVRRLPI